MSSLPSNPKKAPTTPPDTLQKKLGVKELTIDWLAGDGSDRQYYRLTSPEIPHSLVLMQLSGADALALKANGYDWVNIAHILRAEGITVPEVIATLPEHAALVIEDYGNLMLEGEIFRAAKDKDENAIQSAYSECTKVIARLLKIKPTTDAPWTKRAFDKERYSWELQFFRQKYFELVVGGLTSKERAEFDRDVTALSEFLAGYSTHFVHRDFHSRNIMLFNGKFAVIDFQDSRLGGAAYDLVSLACDSYVPLTKENRLKIIEQAISTFSKTISPEVGKEVEQTWRPMLLQRQLKAIGSFGYLTLEQKRGDYLKYVTPALKIILEQGVEDSRWPYLSKGLLDRIAKKIGI